MRDLDIHEELTEYIDDALDDAQRGESTFVTRNGRRIAVIVPVSGKDATDDGGLASEGR